jgi:long-subunit fatty acid transport protein
MQKYRFLFRISVGILSAVLSTETSAQLVPVLGSQRAGISAMQFLKIGVGARAAGMGEAFVPISNDVSALFWNPAGIVQFSRPEVFVSHTEWVADIKHEFFGAVYHLSTSDAVGLSVNALHMDEMQVTTELQPRGTGEYFKFGDIALGLTYARKMTDQFGFGLTVKYARETIAELRMRSVMVDLGTYYWTGLGTSRFSVAVTNFGGQLTPSGSVSLLNGTTVENFQSFSPPTIFRIGFAVEPIDNEDSRLTTAVQLNHPNDNAENLSFGVEYTWHDLLHLRGGYKVNVDEQRFAAGGGISLPLSIADFGFDYAYSSFGRLGNVHRVSLNLRL